MQEDVNIPVDLVLDNLSNGYLEQIKAQAVQIATLKAINTVQAQENAYLRERVTSVKNDTLVEKKALTTDD